MIFCKKANIWVFFVKNNVLDFLFSILCGRIISEEKQLKKLTDLLLRELISEEEFKFRKRRKEKENIKIKRAKR